MELPAAPGRSINRQRSATILTVFCVGYFLFLILLVVALRTFGDRSSWATLLLFAPRWPWVLLLVALVPLTLWRNRRLTILLALAAVVGICPLMGFCLGWRRLLSQGVQGTPLRVAAFNVHHLNLEDPAVERFYADTHADVVALEEVPPQFNHRLFPAPEWRVVQKNELCIASRFPLISVKEALDGAALICRLNSPGGPMEVIVVHLGSPHYALRDAVEGSPEGHEELAMNIATRRSQAAFLRQQASAATGPLMIVGDFNLTPDSPLFTSNFSDLSDSFEATGVGFGWTYHNRWTAVRIDHVLTNGYFDRSAFLVGPDLGSPHRPIVADLFLRPSR